MAHVHENSVWSSGNSVERSAIINKSMTTTKRAFCQELFPKIQKQEDGEAEQENAESEGKEEAEVSAPSPEEGPDSSDAILERALMGCGYAKDLLGNNGFKSMFAKAMSRKGEVVSQRTGKLWVERAIPEEPPAFVRPDKLKLGDRVQVLNWVPMGVHGAKIDLFPEGNVSKIYKVKCLVTKEPLPFGVLPGDDSEFAEEDRIVGLELDGKGPYATKESNGAPFPYVTKDSTVIIRFPTFAEPNGQTDHASPMVI